MIVELKTLNAAQVAVEFHISEGHVRTLCRQKKLTTIDLHKRAYVIHIDEKYEDLKKLYDIKYKLKHISV